VPLPLKRGGFYPAAIQVVPSPMLRERLANGGNGQSVEPECPFLRAPQLGKIEASSEVNDGQFGRLTALDDRLYNPRRQESERQDLPYVAPGHAGSPGDVADRCGRSDTLSRMRSPITSRSN
jgi:hypothetical protein